MTLCWKGTVFSVLHTVPVPSLRWLGVHKDCIAETELSVSSWMCHLSPRLHLCYQFSVIKTPGQTQQWPLLLCMSKNKLQTSRELDRVYDEAEEHHGCSCHKSRVLRETGPQQCATNLIKWVFPDHVSRSLGWAFTAMLLWMNVLNPCTTALSCVKRKTDYLESTLKCYDFI